MSSIPYIDAETIARNYSYKDLLASLKKALTQVHDVPERMHYEIGERLGLDNRLLLMVAWGAEKYLGIKMVTLCAGNEARNLPTLSGVYCLFDGSTGQPLAMLDGAELTAIRTAGASVLASTYLLQDTPDEVLIIGAGKLSSYYIKAYAEIIKPKRIVLWNRDQGKAEKVVQNIEIEGIEITSTNKLEQAVKRAEVICTITSSSQPLFSGKWVQPGCHLDMAGGYRPDMREADDDVIKRASIYVDSYQGAYAEAGDIIDPLNRGVISKQDIRAELVELVRRGSAESDDRKEITVFKSVGLAIEDLAAAVMIYENR